MAVSVYSNEGIITKMHCAIGDLYRSFFSRLSPETLITITDSLVNLFRFPTILYLDPMENYRGSWNIDAERLVLSMLFL